MCLRFAFLLITRMTTWLRLSRREAAWQAAEILILRHQLAVLQRRQPRRPLLTWADRALLAALLSVIPKARRQGLRLLVTPGHDPALAPRHRPAPLGCQIQAGQDRPPDHQPGHQGPGPPAGQGEPRLGIPPDPRRAGRPGSQGRGQLAGLGAKVAASTVWGILRTNGIDPAARRTGPTWAQFLRSQAEAILACGFFSVDLLDGTQAYVLTVIGHAARRIRILGVTLHPTGDWTTQQARNLIMDLGDQAERMKFMIRDRGSNFTAAFDTVLADAGIRTVLCNVRTPRMNAIAERWIGDAAASSWTAPLSGTRAICSRSCAITRITTTSTGLTVSCTARRR
jgi:putative transposase